MDPGQKAPVWPPDGSRRDFSSDMELDATHALLSLTEPQQYRIGPDQTKEHRVEQPTDRRDQPTHRPDHSAQMPDQSAHPLDHSSHEIIHSAHGFDRSGPSLKQSQRFHSQHLDSLSPSSAGSTRHFLHMPAISAAADDRFHETDSSQNQTNAAGPNVSQKSGLLSKTTSPSRPTASSHHLINHMNNNADGSGGGSNSNNNSSQPMFHSSGNSGYPKYGTGIFDRMENNDSLSLPSSPRVIEHMPYENPPSSSPVSNNIKDEQRSRNRASRALSISSLIGGAQPAIAMGESPVRTPTYKESDKTQSSSKKNVAQVPYRGTTFIHGGKVILIRAHALNYKEQESDEEDIELKHAVQRENYINQRKRHVEFILHEASSIHKRRVNIIFNKIIRQWDLIVGDLAEFKRKRYSELAEKEYEEEIEAKKGREKEERERLAQERKENMEREERERKRRRNERRAALARERNQKAQAEQAEKKAAAQEAETEAIQVEKKQESMEEIQEQIWRELCRRQIPKVWKIIQIDRQNKMGNLKKTSLLAAKEAKKWQIKTNKGIRDLQMKAKRTMREMLYYWKKNEREERENRRKAEKDLVEKMRKEEEEREARRQARKLNFLITQTELYSHFIGGKIPEEQKTDDADMTEQLDFDEDNDEALHRKAMQNARYAVDKARQHANTFSAETAAAAAAASATTGIEIASESQESRDQDYNEGEMNFTNPQIAEDINVQQPQMLKCELKGYQIKGLNWLVNLYEQGINGILADEMGLGKTVQSISLIAYLAETHNIWGPFLVIAPASTLHNWQQELTKFVPDLRPLPYWGNGKDRRILRKFWSKKNMQFSRDAPFHIIITSYQLVVQDAQYFQRIRWQYMILDEAQAIKSSQSARWKNLLGFQCRNRLLLTGTPIQNTMQELWALLHFIKPTLIDSHEEFSDWFSKDIESHAQSNTQLNEQQLRRLHMILKPFMLRRVKKNVQSELGEKIEKELFCDMTYRQRLYYRSLMDKISISVILEKVNKGNNDDVASLMNLVMQFRKVCNHPDLFERADVTSPFCFAEYADTASLLRENELYASYATRSMIKFQCPKLLYRDGGLLEVPSWGSKAGFRRKYLENVLNIRTPDKLSANCWTADSVFATLRLCRYSPEELAYLFQEPLMMRALHDYLDGNRSERRRRLISELECDIQERTVAKNESHHVQNEEYGARTRLNKSERLDDIVLLPEERAAPQGALQDLCMVSRQIFLEHGMNRIQPMFEPTVSAPPVDVWCSDIGFEMEKRQLMFDPQLRKILYGPNKFDEDEVLYRDADPFNDSAMLVPSLLPQPMLDRAGFSHIEIPSMSHFVSDSGKLALLDKLLAELKVGGHRVLLYFQMTRMIDMMEEYLTYRQYKYLRLDGSSRISDRRDMVNDWQTRPELFVFLLSTRAGGLGINLTAADTVIFYDSDWNPTIDSQAADRAHRLGQTKQVTVYRLITRGTIEERILHRAREKEEVQKVVISGGEFKSVDFNKGSREVVSWLLDDETLEMNAKNQAKRKATDAFVTSVLNDAGRKRVKKDRRSNKPQELSLDDLYHEGEGNFDTDSPSRPSSPSGKSRGR